ncbi:MAG: ABC transporter substrate-binding protein [Opitutaceae bacterium]|nr:ABC transporter substrate-binding protein [Opitutaceae bacterium]
MPLAALCFRLALAAAAAGLAGCLPRDLAPAAANASAVRASAPVSRAPSTLDPAILAERRFQEAPLLAERVAAGKLPPVAERLPLRPLVLQPLEEIGSYGGTIRRDMATEFADLSTIRATMNENLLSHSRPFAGRIELNLAESYTMSDDGRRAVFHLRPGLRWSDGVPFTADDIVFWYDDLMMDQNAYKMGVPNRDWVIEGHPVRMRKVDDLTLEITCERAMGMLLRRLCHYEFVMAKHHYARFHPRYNPQATYRELKEETTDQNQLYRPGVPKLGAWVPVRWVRGQQVVFERNPYFWKVDTAGHQLPYADRVAYTSIPDPQVTLLKFTNGEIDLIGRNIRMDAVPSLLAQLETGRYRIYSRQPEPGPAFYLNWDAEDPELRAAFRQLDVRRALSLAINRREISSIVFLGMLHPGGFAFSSATPYYSPEDFARNAEYDPAQARALLARAGYRDADGDGFLEFPDGRRFELTIDITSQWGLGDVTELVREYWRAVGVFVHLNFGREEIIYSRRLTGKFQVYFSQWIAAGVEPRNSPIHWGVTQANMPFWHRRAFEEGAPEWLREATRLINEIMTTPQEEKVRPLMLQLQRIYVENVPAIGLGALGLPWAANVRLGNVPPDGTFSNAYSGWSRGIFHEQIFIRPDPAAHPATP